MMMIYRLFVIRSAFILFMFFSQSGKDMEHRAVGDLSLNKSLSSTSVCTPLTVSYVVWKSIVHPAKKQTKNKTKNPPNPAKQCTLYNMVCNMCTGTHMLVPAVTSEEYTAHFDNHLASSTCTLLYHRHSFVTTKAHLPNFLPNYTV